MPGIKELKNRIKSIKSTRKITKAMQMVSAAKMRKAQGAVVGSRTYAGLAWELVESLGGLESVIPEALSASERLSGIQVPMLFLRKIATILDPGSRLSSRSLRHSAGMTQGATFDTP